MISSLIFMLFACCDKEEQDTAVDTDDQVQETAPEPSQETEDTAAEGSEEETGEETSQE
tara:strand:- start:1173 stop:1349 length:177 start_codon:yes stop_codon:yes gene_type:complete